LTNNMSPGKIEWEKRRVEKEKQPFHQKREKKLVEKTGKKEKEQEHVRRTADQLRKESGHVSKKKKKTRWAHKQKNKPL